MKETSHKAAEDAPAPPHGSHDCAKLDSISAPPRPGLSRVLIFFVLVYRATLGHFLGGHCRYYPTCSQYAIDAINKHGPWRGAWKALRRIARCHPWGGKGYDPA